MMHPASVPQADMRVRLTALEIRVRCPAGLCRAGFAWNLANFIASSSAGNPSLTTSHHPLSATNHHSCDPLLLGFAVHKPQLMLVRHPEPDQPSLDQPFTIIKPQPLSLVNHSLFTILVADSGLFANHIHLPTNQPTNEPTRDHQ